MTAVEKHDNEITCQCAEDARGNPQSEREYEPQEYKALRHAPNECPGDYELRLYHRSDGSEAWLCSCCTSWGDVPMSRDSVEASS